MKEAHAFLTNFLNTKVPERTARIDLSSWEISMRATGVDSKDMLTFDEKVDLYKKKIQRLCYSGSTSNIMCSLYFTYASHRTWLPMTLAVQGRKSSAQLSETRFTNCIITGLFFDGRQLSSIFYIYNPLFRTGRKETKHKKLAEV